MQDAGEVLIDYSTEGVEGELQSIEPMNELWAQKNINKNKNIDFYCHDATIIDLLYGVPLIREPIIEMKGELVIN